MCVSLILPKVAQMRFEILHCITDVYIERSLKKPSGMSIAENESCRLYWSLIGTASISHSNHVQTYVASAAVRLLCLLLLQTYDAIVSDKLLWCTLHRLLRSQVTVTDQETSYLWSFVTTFKDERKALDLTCIQQSVTYIVTVFYGTSWRAQGAISRQWWLLHAGLHVKASVSCIKDMIHCFSWTSGPVQSEVRLLACEAELPNMARRDSQGICFLGKVKFDEFVEQHLGTWHGPLVDEDTNEVVGFHKGFWFYTPGQRKGIELSGGPW